MARLVKKTNIRATLDTFEVGDEMVIETSVARYSNVYVAAKEYERKTGKKFYVSYDGIPNGTLVRRLV